MAMPVRLNGHIDEIRVVEASHGSVQRGIVELPVGRPELPQQSDNIATVLPQSGPAALRMEIPLVPVPMFLRGRSRPIGRRNVLNVVAVDRYQGTHALRPQRSCHASAATAP